MRLDDFYRDGDDPALPTVFLAGRWIGDWDDPRSWDGKAAVAALRRLVTSGSVDVPDYDLSRSAVVGTTRLVADASSLVVAEGIFAAEVIDDLRREGLLHSAWCVRHRRGITFLRRLFRDLAERRKPPHVLVRRGLLLWRTQPRVVERMERLGAVAATPAQVEQALGPGVGQKRGIPGIP